MTEATNFVKDWSVSVVCRSCHLPVKQHTDANMVACYLTFVVEDGGTYRDEMGMFSDEEEDDD